MTLNMQEAVGLLFYSSKNVLRGYQILIGDKTGEVGKELVDINAHSFDPFVFNVYKNKLCIFMCIDKNKKDNVTQLDVNNDIKCILMYTADYRYNNNEIFIDNIVFNHTIRTKNNDQRFTINGEYIYIKDVVKYISENFCSLPLKIYKRISDANFENSSRPYFHYCVNETNKMKYPYCITIDGNDDNVTIDHYTLNFLKDARTTRDMILNKVVDLNKLREDCDIIFDYGMLLPFLVESGLINPYESLAYLSVICKNDDDITNALKDWSTLIKYLNNPAQREKFKNMVKKSNLGHHVHKWCDSEECQAVQQLCQMYDLQRHWKNKQPVQYDTIKPKHFFAYLHLICRVKTYVLSLR